jgi:L-fucose isomerase-like protein
VILVVGRGPDATSQAIQETFGTKVVPLGFEQLNEAYSKADRAQARRCADRWIGEAEKVVEPVPEEIHKSGAMYVAMRNLIEQHHAQVIAVNCLGGFYGGNMAAYPCLGFFQLNNDGLVGACEADLESAFTMLLMRYLVGRPGYISDPVIDTATNQIVYLHCVAPNKVFGPQGPANPYHIRSHAEDGKGAAVRSLMPLGEMTTSLRFAPTSRQVIFHQAKTVANIDHPMSCRTKLAAEVQGDMDRLMNEWDRWGWHRVTFYGDFKREVNDICTLLGFKVIEEA